MFINRGSLLKKRLDGKVYWQKKKMFINRESLLKKHLDGKVYWQKKENVYK